MKKLIALALLLVMTFAAVSCAKEDEPIDPEKQKEGWANFDDFTADELEGASKPLLEDAIESVEDEKIVPVTLLGTKVITGTRYAYLVVATPRNTQNPRLQIMIIDHDVDAAVKVVSRKDLLVAKYIDNEEPSLKAEQEPSTGAWNVKSKVQVCDIESQIKEPVVAALTDYDEYLYKPIACAGIKPADNQIALLCRRTTKHATESDLCMVIAKIDGNDAKIISIDNVPLTDFED